MTRGRAAALFGLGLLVLVGLGLGAFGPLVRGRVAAAAAKRGLIVTVGKVRPRIDGLVLNDVDVRASNVPALTLKLREVQVRASLAGSVRGVSATGGEAHLVGSVATLRAQLEAYDASRPKAEAAASEPKNTGFPVEAKDLDVYVRGAEDGEIEAHGVEIRRDGPQVKIAVRDAKGVRAGARLEAGSLVLEAKRGERTWELSSVASQRLALAFPKEPAAPAAAAPLPSPSKPELLQPPSERGLSPRFVERAKAASDRAREVARNVIGALPDGAKIQLDGVEVSFVANDKPVHVGPHRLGVKANRARLDIELTPSAVVPGRTPLALEASVPTDPAEPLTLALRGGPLPLSVLGLQEGDGGLLEVEKGTVEANAKLTLAPAADAVKIEGGGAVAQLSLRHAALSTEPLRGLSASFRLDGELSLDGSHLRVERGELDVGTVHATLSGEASRTAKGHKVKGVYALPLASCQGLLDALPTGLAPKLAGMKMAGMLAVKGAVTFDGTNPAHVPVIELDVVNECRITHAPPEVSVARFRRPFKHQVYAPDGTKVEIESGPGTPSWVPMGAISPYMEAAVRTCEDGRFRTHRGFDYEAIRNSIRENLKAGRFLRGASTVSMQTVKNVWLDRDKTLGRKIAEAVLTVYLEQELSKDEILELYLNDIEFGPMIYGIGPAAQHYFHTSPGALSLSQALYLGSILPSPKKAHFGEGGRLSPGRAKYLWTLMKMMEKRHLIDAQELALGLTEIPVFGQPAPHRTGPVPGLDGGSVELLEAP